MPSSSLAEVEFEVEVGVEVDVGVGRSILGMDLLFRSGGWVVGNVESKANLNSSFS